MTKLGLFLSVVLGFSVSANAAMDRCNHDIKCATNHNCGKHTVEIRQLGSGQDGDIRAKLEDAANQLYQDISIPLGLDIPNSVITHLTAAEMSALAMTAGHPAPHWIDGAEVLGGARNAGGILEFVVPGPVHYQYVRDTNTFHESLLVYAHVAGHYDFAENSPLFKTRDPDQMGYSLQLAELMTKIKQEVNYSDFSEWYHRLKSLENMQDITRGSFAPIETLQPPTTGTVAKIKDGKIVFEQGQNPSSPTQGLLQAFVANLPTGTEPWKIQMAQLFEKLHKVGPAYYQTKYMNEGWAVLLEYIILSHSKWNTSSDAGTFAHTNSGVAYPALSNPYWLGWQAWARLRARFNERPEIAPLTPVEKDREFIKYAHEIIRSHTDYSFLRMALDTKWVEDLKLVLYRHEDEYDWRTGPIEQKRAITRDPKRIANAIANQIVNRDLQLPKIELTNFNEGGTGIASIRHIDVNGVPLSRKSMATTLYVLANILNRPIKLDTIWNGTWAQHTQNFTGFFQPPGLQQDVTPFTMGKMTLVVTPSGQVALDLPPAEGPQAVDTKVLQEELLKEFQISVDAFKADTAMSYEPGRNGSDLASSHLETTPDGAEGLAVANKLQSHSPTAAESVIDYYRMVKSRLDQILRLSAKGKLPIVFKNGKVRVKVLPDTPEFSLDRSVISKRKLWLRRANHTPIDYSQSPHGGAIGDAHTPMMKTGLPLPGDAKPIPDEDLDITGSNAQPGDVFDRKPKGQGQGQGEGEEGEEEGDEEGQGDQAGQGGDGDLKYEDVSMEDFGRILSEEIELRNLRRTKGENTIQDDILIGSERRASGDVIWNRTAIEAIRVGKALEYKDRKNNKDNPEAAKKKKSLPQLLKDGMRALPQADYRVRSRENDPEPDFDAVIVFVADTSGSMGPEHRKIERDMIKNEIALLKFKYPRLKTHFVIYGSGAREVTEAQFFKTYDGGGTETSKGIKLAQEILDKYPRSRYNRFAQLFSDGDDFDSLTSVAEGRKLAGMTEYFGYANVHPYGQEGQMSKAFEAMSNENPDLAGYASLTSNRQTIFEAMKKFFGRNNIGQASLSHYNSDPEL